MVQIVSFVDNANRLYLYKIDLMDSYSEYSNALKIINKDLPKGFRSLIFSNVAKGILKGGVFICKMSEIKKFILECSQYDLTNKITITWLGKVLGTGANRVKSSYLHLHENQSDRVLQSKKALIIQIILDAISDESMKRYGVDICYYCSLHYSTMLLVLDKTGHADPVKTLLRGEWINNELFDVYHDMVTEILKGHDKIKSIGSINNTDNELQIGPSQLN